MHVGGCRPQTECAAESSVQDLFVFPDYRPSNPYQTLYYGPLSDRAAIRYRSISETLAHLARFPTKSPIFHLHWEDAVFRDKPLNLAQRAARDFVAGIDRFKQIGGRFVWTVHNLAPHDEQHLDVHGQLVADLSYRADKIQFHSKRAAEHVSALRSLPSEKTVVTPHGNYVDRIPVWAGTKDEARAKLGIRKDRRVFLIFGRLGAYKGVKAFLDWLRSRARDDCFAIIAGKQIDQVHTHELEQDGRTLVRPRFVSEPEVPIIFAAADFVVAPYVRVMTSGTVMLALSLGRPVIAPNLFHIADVVTHGENGLLYDHSVPGALEACLTSAMSREDVDEMSNEARLCALKYCWQDIADATIKTLY